MDICSGDFKCSGTVRITHSPSGSDLALEIVLGIELLEIGERDMSKHMIVGYNNARLPSVVDTEVRWTFSEAVATANAMTWFTDANYAVVYDDSGKEVYRYNA